MRFVLVIICIASWVTGATAQVAVIANKDVPLNSIGQSELLDLFTGETSYWENGEPVVVFDLKIKGAVRDSFYEFVGIRASRMKSIWLKRLLAGDADPPEAFQSEEELLKRVAETSGSIGFLQQSSVDDGVKILTIIEE